MIVEPQPLAAEAGSDVLRCGDKAVDALDGAWKPRRDGSGALRITMPGDGRRSHT